MSSVDITGYNHGKRKLEPNFTEHTRRDVLKEKGEETRDRRMEVRHMVTREKVSVSP